MPIIGSRVQPDVDLVVIPQVLPSRLVGDERHSIACDALRGEQVLHALAMSPFTSQQDEPRAIHGFEDLRPQLENRRVDLTEVIETTKSNLSFRGRRQRVDGRLAVIRLVAPERVGQPDRFLGVVFVKQAGRI